MNTRKITNLRHQFGKLAPSLTSDQLKRRLVDAGLIKLLDGGRYAETPKMRALPRGEFMQLVSEILNEGVGNA